MCVNTSFIAKSCLFVVCFCPPASLLAQQILNTTPKTALHGPHELMGLLLRQSRSAVEAELGTPFHKQARPDGAAGFAYHVPHSPNTYIVVIYDKDKAATIELTGTDYSGPTGFLKIRLGDSDTHIQATLGKPAAVTHEDDVNVDLWDYKNANYSLEFDTHHRLYSIQIVDESHGQPRHFASIANLHSFAVAVQSHDVDAQLKAMSGEITCGSFARGYERFQSSARTALSDEKSRLSACLSRAAAAILQENSSKQEAQLDVRMWTDGGTGAVVKMQETSSLKEVVFVVEQDEWRVYEVTFR